MEKDKEVIKIPGVVIPELIKMPNMVIPVVARADGRIEYYPPGKHHTVTAAGRTHVADQLSAAPSEAPMGWMAIGTGVGGVGALTNEILRVALTSKTHLLNVVTYLASFTGVAATITEVGVFNLNVLGGIMMLYNDAQNVTLGAGDTITFTWQLTAN